MTTGTRTPAYAESFRRWRIVPRMRRDVAVRDLSLELFGAFPSPVLLAPIGAQSIVHPDADGVVVSNHGGRQVDGAIAALDALPGVVEVRFDSGVRIGSDAFKTLALGARAVLLGRPYLWGLAVAGERGVRHLVLAECSPAPLQRV